MNRSDGKTIQRAGGRLRVTNGREASPTGVARTEENMDTEPTSKLLEIARHTRRPQRQCVNTTDLMQGAREVILLHEGEEYLLRITKSGKLILTK